MQQRDRQGKGPRVALQERARGRASGRGLIMQSPRATRLNRPVRGSLKQAPAMLLWVQWHHGARAAHAFGAQGGAQCCIASNACVA